MFPAQMTRIWSLGDCHSPFDASTMNGVGWIVKVKHYVFVDSHVQFARVKHHEKDTSLEDISPKTLGSSAQQRESSRRLLKWRERNGCGHWLLTTECAASVLYEVNSSISEQGRSATKTWIGRFHCNCEILAAVTGRDTVTKLNGERQIFDYWLLLRTYSSSQKQTHTHESLPQPPLNMWSFTFSSTAVI